MNKLFIFAVMAIALLTSCEKEYKEYEVEDKQGVLYLTIDHDPWNDIPDIGIYLMSVKNSNVYFFINKEFEIRFNDRYEYFIGTSSTFDIRDFKHFDIITIEKGEKVYYHISREKYNELINNHNK